MEKLLREIEGFVSLQTKDESNKLSEREIFLSEVYDGLSEEYDQCELALSDYDSITTDMRIDGFDLVKEDLISLYISDYGDANLREFTKHDYEQLLCKAVKFIQESKEGLYKKLDDSTEIYRLSEYIYNYSKKIHKYHIFVVTNGIRNFGDKIDLKKLAGASFIEDTIIDLDKIKELKIFEHEEIEEINANLLSDFGVKYQCVECPSDDEDKKVYLFFIDGRVLGSLYEQYGYDLLDGNVRAYLKKTQKVNKGIYETIKNEPYNFSIFNNGLSTVANSVIIDPEGNITEIKGWRIVNGGQTTATIDEALKNKIDLKNVKVAVKMTVLYEHPNDEEFIAKISECANTQNKVNKSDFSSNEKYHVELESLSRNVSVPSNIENHSFEKWFYERTKGKYDLERARKSKDIFEAEFPKKKKFDKTLLAKAVMSWEQEPFTVSLGKEKNFMTFNNRIRANSGLFKLDEEYYQDLIGSIILFKYCDKRIGLLKQGGYKANILTYVIAELSYLSNRKLNLKRFWELQEVPEALDSIIDDLAKEIYNIITNPPVGNTNVAMWCRKKECWNQIRDYDFNIKIPSVLLSENQYDFAKQTEMTSVNGKLKDVMEVTANEWGSISVWGKETELLTANERKMAFSMLKAVQQGRSLSPKQIDYAKSIFKKACENGFEMGE